MNTSQIQDVVQKNKIVVFAKGTKFQPMCGFSAYAMDILNRTEKPYEVVNIFDEPDTRENLIAWSKWPTTPQVFVAGELLGGSDIIDEMYKSGELQKKIEAAFA